MIWALLTGLWRLAVSLPFWWLYLVKHSPMHGLCHCLELFINSMWWVYKVHSFHKDIVLIATSNCRFVSSVGCVPYSAKQRFMDSASTEALRPCPVYPSLRKYYCLKGGLCSSKGQLPLVSPVAYCKILARSIQSGQKHQTLHGCSLGHVSQY